MNCKEGLPIDNCYDVIGQIIIAIYYVFYWWKLKKKLITFFNVIYLILIIILNAVQKKHHVVRMNYPDKSTRSRFQVHFFQINSRNRKNERMKKFSEIQYLDLDLDSGDNSSTPGLVKKSSENIHAPATATVYKTVDFIKTEAFNRTRIEIEEQRSRLCMAAESSWPIYFRLLRGKKIVFYFIRFSLTPNYLT